MPIRDIFLALLIILAWGLNFVVIKMGVSDIPPLLLACLRFSLVAFPAILFFKRPQVPLKLLFGYALTLSFCQFAFLFISIKLGMPVGLASLILQAQAFFTLVFSAVFLSEKIRPHHIFGMCLAAIGIVLLANSHASVQTTIHFIPLLFILAAAVAWAFGNIFNKMIVQRYPVNIMSLVVWSALIPILPFLLSSWLFEGSDAIGYALTHLHVRSIFAVCYLAFIATILGYGLWGYLLSRYEAGRIAPLTLLVPVVGMVSAAIFANEHLTHAQIIATLVIILGLIINVFGLHIWQKIKKPIHLKP
ncbi:MAG: EamA family transporter [Acinetobacter sp.]